MEVGGSKFKSGGEIDQNFVFRLPFLPSRLTLILFNDKRRFLGSIFRLNLKMDLHGPEKRNPGALNGTLEPLESSYSIAVVGFEES